MSSPILIVPACAKGQGGGHLNRSLILKRRLEEEGRDVFLWIGEAQKEDVFGRFSYLYKSSDSRIISNKEELSGRKWENIILDNFKTSRREFDFWAGLKNSGLNESGSARLIGIDEGGPRRKRFDFLIICPSFLAF